MKELLTNYWTQGLQYQVSWDRSGIRCSWWFL